MAEGAETVPRIERRPTFPGARVTNALTEGALYLLLIDAAVETFLAGSQVRWIVAGTVLAYLALTVLLWRKLTLRASASFVVLLGLLAFSAWRPGGMSAGVMLLRQPTSTVLTTVTALAILLAGWTVTHVKRVPLAGRVIVALLAIYGLAAVSVAIPARTPYPDLFHGQSFWSRLPFWLQGAFVGGLVVLPLGLVGQILRHGLRGWWTTGADRWSLQKLIALCLSFLMVLPGMGPGRAGSAASRDQTVATVRPTASVYTPPGPPVSLETPLEQPPTGSRSVEPEELIAKTEALIRKISPERYAVSALATTLGPGMEPAFAFVRDRVRYEAYPGVLRGAEGTFTARAGNALDRSLLLARLLALKGVPTRYASGRLARAEAEALYAHVFDAPTTAGAMPALLARLPPEARSFWTRVETRARRDYQVVRAALGASLPGGSRPSRGEVLREIEQHVWIQAQADGRWVDIDSSFGDATVGRAYAGVERTFDELPAEWHQRVTVRVATDLLAEGKLQTKTVLELTMAADDLVDRQVFLVHVPKSDSATGAGGLGFTVGQSGSAWAPALWVDGEFQVGEAISFENAPAADIGSELAGGGATTDGSFVAEWLEFDVRFPDGRHDVTRRALVDRAGMVWRRAGSLNAEALRPLVGTDSGPAAVQAIHNIWFTAGRHDVAAYTQAVNTMAHALARPDAVESSVPDPQFGEQVWPLALQNFAFLLWSDHWAVPAVNDAPQVRLYPDSPRIFVFSVGPDPAEAPDALYRQIDLRRDWLRGLARDPSLETSVIERKIWFGTIEGALEHESVAEDAARSGVDTARVTSTSSLLTSEGAILASPVGGPQTLVAVQETVARIQHALDSGELLVVPRAVLRGGRAGWWQIAVGGNTRAVMDDDLNAVRTVYGPPRGPGGTYRVFPDGSCVDLGRLQPQCQKRKGRGTEWIILITAIALTAIAIITRYSKKKAAAAEAAAQELQAADAGEAADGGN